jgi:hypothetical protein
MWLGTGSGTGTLIATLSAIASIGGFFAYLHFAQRGDANTAREEAVSLAETRREVIADLRRRLAEAEERHERLQRLYAVGLFNVLESVRRDLTMVPPNVDRALERIRALLARASSAR